MTALSLQALRDKMPRMPDELAQALLCLDDIDERVADWKAHGDGFKVLAGFPGEPARAIIYSVIIDGRLLRISSGDSRPVDRVLETWRAI